MSELGNSRRGLPKPGKNTNKGNQEPTGLEQELSEATPAHASRSGLAQRRDALPESTPKQPNVIDSGIDRNRSGLSVDRPSARQGLSHTKTMATLESNGDSLRRQSLNSMVPVAAEAQTQKTIQAPTRARKWAGRAVIVTGSTVLTAAILVVGARWLMTLEPVIKYVNRYPGEYELPIGAVTGFPVWLGWQHFFNAFILVMIVRSGLSIRRETRPRIFWTARGKTKTKVSLTIWSHQALDVLWLANGMIFIVLIVITGHWQRIVPTSLEVFPNAASALLQYASLNWPVENGWVNYNSLQQLAYFTTVFIAAPLAAITGLRMSMIWPKRSAFLNRIYPVAWARAIHFPVMVYFIVFVFLHVFLVLSTGALRNLNHMYGAQDAENWFGFWMFVLSLLVMVGGWFALRTMVFASVARLFGTVSR